MSNVFSPISSRAPSRLKSVLKSQEALIRGLYWNLKTITRTARDQTIDDNLQSIVGRLDVLEKKLLGAVSRKRRHVLFPPPFYGDGLGRFRRSVYPPPPWQEDNPRKKRSPVGVQFSFG